MKTLTKFHIGKHCLRSNLTNWIAFVCRCGVFIMTSLNTLLIGLCCGVFVSVLLMLISSIGSKKEEMVKDLIVTCVQDKPDKITFSRAEESIRLYKTDIGNTDSLSEFSLSVTGFSSDPKGKIKYKDQEDKCTIYFYPESIGTSNSTELTFNVPFKANWNYAFICGVIDNGVRKMGVLHFTKGSDIVRVYPSINGSQWATFGQKAFYTINDSEVTYGKL